MSKKQLITVAELQEALKDINPESLIINTRDLSLASLIIEKGTVSGWYTLGKFKSFNQNDTESNAIPVIAFCISKLPKDYWREDLRTTGNWYKYLIEKFKNAERIK